MDLDPPVPFDVNAEFSRMRGATRQKELIKWGAGVGMVLISLFVTIQRGCHSTAQGRMSAYGQIKMNGQAVSGGTIRYLPIRENKAPAVAGEIRGGSYSLDAEHGVIPGNYEVLISLPPQTGKFGLKEGEKPQEPPPPPAPPPATAPINSDGMPMMSSPLPAKEKLPKDWHFDIDVPQGSSFHQDFDLH